MGDSIILGVLLIILLKKISGPSVQFKMINNQLYLEVKNKWKSIYPIYFDSTKTLQQGRRMPKSLCIKQPTLQEVIKAICMSKLRHIIEPHKCYSRDYFQMGRMKIQLLQENGKPVHTHLPNKMSMLRQVGKHLRELRKQ